MVSAKTIAVAATVTAAVAGLGYIAYFDYKRRHDRKFRRKLRKDRKKLEKTAQKITDAASLDDISDQALELLNLVAKEKLPESPEEKEKFFMAQVSQGETLCAAGPSGYIEAACRFYQALKVYPNPVELVMIYQKTTPDEVFKLVMAMMAQEVRQKQARYFDVFPSKDKNVEIKDKNKLAADKAKGADKKDEVVTPNRGLFATKDFAANEIIYEEESVVSTLLPCAKNGRFCYHCMKNIPESKETDAPAAENKEDEPSSEKTEEDNVNSSSDSSEEKSEQPEIKVDGSEEPESFVDAVKSGLTPETLEEEAAKAVSEQKPQTFAEAVEVGLTPELPEKSSGALECDKCHQAFYCSEKCRQDAYDAYHQFMCTSSSDSTAREFADLAKRGHELAPVMIAKFFSVLVDREKKKELARVLGTASASEEDEYTTWEHLECMRYLELIPSPHDAVMLRKLSELMSRGVPGISDFVTSDRYTTLKGKLDYNTYAVHNSDDSVEVPEDTEETHVSDTMRNSRTSGAVGISLYLISSHITHDCDPNVEITFPDNTDKAAIRTIKPVAKGEELHVSFVDPALDRVVRQKKLSSSYRIVCSCDKCKAENAAAADEAEKEAEKDTETKEEELDAIKATDEEAVEEQTAAQEETGEADSDAETSEDDVSKE
ncbi:mitochondrial import receptor subunit tom20 [Coemansia sp. RSA 2607]|nr:mitochondrial import receptor subunit tom20 [Coemansia sp. RSA 2607]